MKYIILFFITIHSLFASSYLTDEEKDFLKKHPVIKVHNEQNWKPYNFNRDEKPAGYTIDVLNMLVKKLGIEIKYVSGDKWFNYLTMLKNKEIDLIGNITKTKDRENYLLFTNNTIINEKPLIFAKKDRSLFFDLSSLNGYTVAVVKGFWYEELLKKEFPNIKILLVDEPHQTINAVINNEADAIIDIKPVIDSLLAEKNINEIIAVGEAKFKQQEDISIKIGVRNDYPLLVSALDKAFDRSYVEIQKIKSKWFDNKTELDLQKNYAIKLNKEEKSWIENNIINVGVESWSPVVFFNKETNSIDGFSGEIFKEIVKRFNLKVKYHDKLFHELLNDFKERKIDILPDTYFTKERDKFGLFTKPYFYIKEFLYVNSQKNNIKTLDDLKNKKLAIIKEYGTISKVKQKYPQVNIVETKDIEDSINKLLTNEVDAYLDTQIVVENYLANNFIVGIKGIPQNSFPSSSLHFFVNKDKPILFSIIKKGLETIDIFEKNKIIAKWVTKVNEKSNTQTVLNPENISYLKKYKTLKMCVAPNWMPFEAINSKGEHDGIGSDFKSILEKKLNKSIKIVKTENWSESLAKAKTKECDILSLSKKTPIRSKYLFFTKPIISIQYVIATKNNQFFIDDINNFKNKKFAVVRDYAVEEDLRSKYPKIKLELVSSVKEGLEKVNEGKVFAYIDSAPSIAYAMEENGLVDIKIAGQLPISYDLSYGIRNDDIKLYNIFEKVIQSINEKDINRIFKKWVTIKYQQIVDYSLIWQIVIAAVFVLSLLYYWNRKIVIAKDIIEKQNKELEILATTDKLTGVFNRSKLDELLLNEINRNLRYSHAFGCAIIDIDHFKHTNDTFGHLIGDKVLKEITKVVKENIRNTDYFGRWGGEEFLLILPEIDKDGLEQLIEKIRNSISKYHIDKVGIKTVSIGATIYQKNDTPDVIIKRADDALYKAKDTGRNKTIIY
ncbi:transporter substrate-binding domain-containing protein [Halarcobacter sp.]|uniref:transporter substrate-binding domain-containing diguanylate cyclase n=1 Tax=Halarcobacter sp. TaxID=2321133 RepID=UPI002AA62B0E|nr:transporter substrate-binding domain-containing protein [Halarcobacter sp.]